ncbi:MAG: nicotinate-nucleotide/dimethylbenzimidazole phosphoribosyltransferase [Candidatus Eremiobacteraeota bacterium]|nr:nicotinate-nucleotide/dimethylbenzimidazole phosphoribosyltransferase [Candidatus Eremiobacteraeota bacterium]
MNYESQWREQIAPAEPAVAAAARARIDDLTKPRGSLGRIEDLAVRLCAIAGGIPAHAFERRALLIAAADHGVAEYGVSAYPSEVTAQMVLGLLGGIAAANAFARAVGADVYVADFGVRTPSPAHDRLIDVRCGAGTANLAEGPAIAAERVEAVVNAGVAAFEALRARAAFDTLALGDLGIGNTTAAAAIVAAFTHTPAANAAGRGTGIDDRRLARKIAAIESGLARIGEHSWRRIASEVGGFEIVGLAGVILAAARARVAVVLDGSIVTAAALLAGAIAPASIDYCIAGHRSREPAHSLALDALGLVPLLDLDLALGEATGATLALPLISAAARMVHEMRTFSEAGVATESVR